MADTADILVVGSALDPRTGLAEIQQHLNEVDVVITDYEMPHIAGNHVCSEIKKLRNDLKVIVFTAFNTSAVVTNCRRAGADAFIFKNAGDEEILSVVRQTYAGKKLLVELDPSGVRTSFPRVDLTPSEIEIVKLIACKCMTTMQAAQVLSRSPHTVETHRKNIMAALEIHTVQELVHFAIFNGYCSDT